MSDDKRIYQAETLSLSKSQIVPRVNKAKDGRELKQKEMAEALLDKDGFPYTRETILRLIAMLKIK